MESMGRTRPGTELPVHFFTIVLNGEPFIRYHLDVFRRLPFRWHWHVIEGVASLVHDTAWSVAAGGALGPRTASRALPRSCTTPPGVSRQVVASTPTLMPPGSAWMGRLRIWIRSLS